MTNFEKLINTIIGENTVQPTTPQQTQTTSTNNLHNPQEDNQLIDLIKQKIQDVKFKEALMKALSNPQQPQQPQQQKPNTAVPVTNTSKV